MTEKFKIVETENKEYRYIIEPTMYVSITRHIQDIVDYLKIRGYKGKVVFDNGLITGNTVGRFVEAYFNGKNFDTSSFVTMFEVPDDIRQIADKALEEIKKSIIKPPEKNEKKAPRKAAGKVASKKENTKSTKKEEKAVKKEDSK